jgi:hypothetical protein
VQAFGLGQESAGSVSFGCQVDWFELPNCRSPEVIDVW